MIVRARAPLRLGLAGGGTDVSPFSDLHGGLILNAAIGKYAYATIERRSDGRVSLVSTDRAENWDGEATSALACPVESLRLLQGVYNRLTRDHARHSPPSVTVTTHSDAPPGSGLGSSSTLVVALVTAFVEFMNLPLGEYDIARLAFEIERVDLALEGGRQDQYAATFGGFNYMEFYAEERVVVNPLRIKEWIVSELEASLVLFYTGVSRASAEIIHEQSSNIKRGDSRSVDAMFALKQDAVLMKETLLKGDFKGMARAMRDSWENKKQTAHKVSNDHIEHIYAKALEAGALGGKVSGAGGGGYMIFLVEPTRRAKVVEALAAFPGQASNVHFTKQGSQAWRVR